MTPVPTPSVTPVFASDEEALAAAEESYKRYLAVSDQIFAEGGANPERLAEVATGTFLEAETEGFKRIAANGWHSVGSAAIHTIDLQQFSPASDVEMVTVYLCDDVGGVDVVGADGISVVSPDRPTETLFEVTFDWESNALLVSGRTVWGDGRC